MITNGQFFDALHISDISVVSGIRSCGRTVDHSACGRKSNGFLFVWSGEATFYSERETVVVSDGELAFLPKHTKYKMKYTAERTTFVVINFDLHGMDHGDTALFSDILLLAKDDATHSIAGIMTDFELCSASKTVETTLRKKELMYRLLGMIYSSKHDLTSKSKSHSQIAEGVRLLEQTYLENLPIAQYAEASHVSISTFRSVFQKQFGTSPLKYRNRLRIARAAELLSEGGFTVAEVAYASGFENVGYFCRYYRQIAGEAPGRTKKKSQTDKHRADTNRNPVSKR